MSNVSLLTGIPDDFSVSEILSSSKNFSVSGKSGNSKRASVRAGIKFPALRILFELVL